MSSLKDIEAIFTIMFIGIISLSFELIYPQDTIVSIDLSQDKSINKDSLVIICDIENKEDKTIIILSSPFFIEGEADFSHKIHPWPGPHFTASMLFYEQVGHKFSFIGDADIQPQFYSFPELLEIAPKEVIRIRLLLPKKYVQLFHSKKLRIWLMVSYGRKNEFEKLVKPHPRIWEQYENSRSKSDVLIIAVDDFDPNRQEKDIDQTVSEIIQKGIKYKAHSEKILMSY